jgi:hypothetical protein
MEKPQPQNVVKLDGRTGEGGGQLVRVSVALAALTGTPLRIDNVRGNREGKRGGGEQYSSSFEPILVTSNMFARAQATTCLLYPVPRRGYQCGGERLLCWKQVFRI